MKKITSILLCIIMLLSVVPTTSFATDYIRDVYITNIPTPIAGVKWEEQSDKSEMIYEDSNYSVFQQPEWYDETEKRFMTPNEAFKVGHTYTVQVWVEANDGYEFDASATAYNMNATINGKEAKLSKAFEYQRWAMAVVSYTFPEVKDNKKITSVSVSDIVEPKIGKQSIARPHYLKYSEGVAGYRVTWYEDYNETQKEFKGVFGAEKTYTLEVIMESLEGYDFARKSTGLPDVSVTFNGKVVPVVAFDGTGKLVARLEYENLGSAKEKIMGIVTFKIQEPVVGAKPSFQAESQREDGLYYLDTLNPGSTKNGITWYEGVGDSRRMDENDTFKAGEYYYVAIRAKPIDGYCFDTDSNGDLLVQGVINSNTVNIVGNEDSLFVSCTFEKLEDEKRSIISEVEATSNYSDIAYVGGKASTPRFTVTKGDPVRIEFVGWQVKDENGEFVNMPDGATFTDAPVKILARMIIDGDANKEYVLANNVKLTVNGIEWLTGHTGFYDDYSACSGVSMSITTSAKEEDIKTPEPEIPQDTPKTTFSDVSKGEYYYDAVMWAVENGITSGTSANTFSPTGICTRGQVVTLLHRMVGSPEPAAITLPFGDVKESDYFYKSVKWAYGSKITGGTSDTTFSPEKSCTRAQVVTFLWRTAGQPTPTIKNNPFKDVKTDSYYYDAVLWAVENQITGGTSADTFSPDANCTRAQVVTFLYRFN